MSNDFVAPEFEVGYYVMNNENGKWGIVDAIENEWATVLYDEGGWEFVHFDDLVDEETYDWYEHIDSLNEAGIYEA